MSIRSIIQSVLIISLNLLVLFILYQIYFFVSGIRDCYNLSPKAKDVGLSIFSILILISNFVIAYKFQKRQPILGIILILTSLSNLFIVIPTVGNFFPTQSYSIDFNANKWKQVRDIRMARNLIENKTLIGKSKQEIEALLGIGERLNLTNLNNVSFYSLEAENFGLQLIFLEIKFENNNVVNVNLRCYDD